MKVNLENMDLYCGEKCIKTDDLQTFSPQKYENDKKRICNEFGPSAIVNRQGPFLLTEKCGLTLQVEKNLENYHNGILNHIKNLIIIYYKCLCFLFFVFSC